MKTINIFFAIAVLFTSTASFAEATEVVDMTTYGGMVDYPTGIASDGTNMWITNGNGNGNSNSVTKVSPTGEMTVYAGMTNYPYGIAFDGVNMWTSNVGYPGSVTKITPTGSMTTYTGTMNNPYRIAFDGVNMWTANGSGNSVTKITPSGGMTTYNFPAMTAPTDIASDGYNVWTVSNYPVSTVTKISPSGGMTTYTGTGAVPLAIAFDGTNMWTANGGDNSVTKITPSGGMTTYIGTGASPNDIAFDGVNMWTLNSAAGGQSVTKITPAGVMTTYTGLPAYTSQIASGGTSMWVTNPNYRSVIKISLLPAVGTIIVSSNIPGASWTITGPQTITGSGVSQSNTSKPVGTYTITWNPVAGYTTPTSQSITLATGGTITFNGTYNIIKSGTITTPSSCLIGDGQSTCTVTSSWTSAGLVSPHFYETNTNGQNYYTPTGSQLVWVAYGGTTFRLTDNTNYTYDTKTVSGTCTPGTTWNNSIGKCHYNATATLTASSTKVSYNGSSTLEWGSTNATSCTPGGAWTNSGTLSGSTSTGKLTSDQEYTFQCFGNGTPSPVITALVDVCPSGTPILKSSVCRSSSVTNTLGNCDYTPNCGLTITSNYNDSCILYKDGAFYQNILPPNGTQVVNLTQAGSYLTKCTTLSDDNITYNVQALVDIDYSPIPPKPIVYLSASPRNISVNSQSILTWKVTYPNSVQVPATFPCTLTAKPACPQGICNASQLLASTTINEIIKTGSTDANDPSGSRSIATSVNNVDDTPANITSGNTHWQARGKKTFILNHSMDFMLRCGDGVNEKQGARVLVTSSMEG